MGGQRCETTKPWSGPVPDSIALDVIWIPRGSKAPAKGAKIQGGDFFKNPGNEKQKLRVFFGLKMAHLQALT